MKTQRLSFEALRLIKERIKEELVKRGIHAEILQFEEVVKNGETKLEFETGFFQTSPVIFKTLKISSAGGSCVYKDKDASVESLVWVSLKYVYSHFGGGSNMCTLFEFRCKVVNNSILDVHFD